jgi:hypothetical protein
LPLNALLNAIYSDTWKFIYLTSRQICTVLQHNIYNYTSLTFWHRSFTFKF